MKNLNVNFKMILLGVVVWTVLVGISLSINIIKNKKHILELAAISARENFNKDQAFRQWGSRHGGVYVPPDKRTPPNPALAHIPNRDVVTTDGMKLTLMNPAYMLRQMMDEYAELYGIRAKITGMVLLNPSNAPDEWEKMALRKFAKGIKEVSEQSTIDGKPFLRLMRPMFMKQSCIKCHGHLGFKVGELRGGVGVAVPLDPYIESGQESLVILWVQHGVIWGIGLMLIITFSYFRSQHKIQLEKNNLLKLEARDAEKSNNIKSEFLSRMSHELRTPLNAILGFAQMLKLDADDFNKTQQGNVNEIITASHYLMNLIGEVLDLSKIESGKLEVTMQQLIIEELMQQVIRLIQPLADERQITIIDNLQCQGLVVMADVTRLKQVLMNLLSNAVKYNQQHGTITLTSKIIDTKYLRIEVTDSGAGLSEDELKRLFIPFERLDNINNVEGTGIGLVISKHLLELMNGRIGVDSRKGHGSTFWFELELAKT